MPVASERVCCVNPPCLLSIVLSHNQLLDSSDLSRIEVQDAKAEAENRLMLTSDKYRQATPAERASMLADDATYHGQIKTWGVGGTVPMAITAVTAAFSGITAGNLGAAASGAMAPYIARQIKAATGDNVIANAMAHAVEGAVLAQMAGNSATAGAVGSAGGELIARSIVATLYPGVEAQNLTEEQKHIVSALSQISSGILGGLEGNSVAAIATAQVAGKNAVENNYLSDRDIITFTEKYEKAKTDAEKEQLRSDLKKLDAAQQAKALATGISVNDQKSELAKLKQLAASSDCVDQCRKLANYSISQLEPIANNTQLHKGNLTKAVLASTIIALTLDQPAKSGEKTPIVGANSASKPASVIDDIVNGTGGAVGAEKAAAEATAVKAAATKTMNGAESVASGARLNMQLAAEQAAGTRAPTKITSYSQHALEQIAGRDGGIGVSKSAIDNAWSSPLKIEYVPSKYGPTFRYTGKDAVIVINQDGKVVTGWAKSSSGTAK